MTRITQLILANCSAIGVPGPLHGVAGGDVLGEGDHKTGAAGKTGVETGDTNSGGESHNCKKKTLFFSVKFYWYSKL